ncbi:MAG: hypothetical protein WBC44_10550 [Planctomycetaceae bacterium]
MLPTFREEEWYVLAERERHIRSELPRLKNEALEAVLQRCPSCKYKSFNGLRNAFLDGKLDESVALESVEYIESISSLETEAVECRRRSDELLAAQANARRRLDPKIDPIPPGPYPKLRNCCLYPLRQDCNYGCDEASNWERCEFMAYDESCSIDDPKRWRCVAPE